MSVWNIVEHGAVADGKTKNTKAFERAIEAASAAGGGRVLVPPGNYVTGPIHLKNEIELHVSRGATILFSKDFDDYPMVQTDYEGLKSVRCISPLWGEELHNVAITGEGTFDGQGEAWRPVKKWKMTAEQWKELVASGGVLNADGGMWFPTPGARDGIELAEKLQRSGRPVRLEDYAPARDSLRPNMVKLSRCTGLVLDGPTFTNSAAWNVHLLECENIAIRNVKILNPWWSTNGDALDLDSCRNVELKDSFFDAGDDAICIKSGKDEAGRKRGKPCENITIANCTVVHGHGGVTIGSEMSGGVRNVQVTNCLFKGTDIGLRFKTTRGRGGLVENIDISNITMFDIRTEAISLNMYYWIKGEPKPEPVTERTPIFRGFTMRNITCVGARRAIEMRGLPEMPIENITLENIRMSTQRGIMLDDVKDVALSGVQLKITEGPALSCHNVKGLRTDRFDTAGPADPITERVGDL